MIDTLRFEFAAKAIASTEAAGLSSAKHDKYVEKRWREVLPQCEAGYAAFMDRQIRDGAVPLPGSL